MVRIRPTVEDSKIASRFQRTVVQQLDTRSLQVEQSGPQGSTLPSQAQLAGKNKATFTFDRVIGPDDGQKDVYECAESLVDSFMAGMNAVSILSVTFNLNMY